MLCCLTVETCMSVRQGWLELAKREATCPSLAVRMMFIGRAICVTWELLVKGLPMTHKLGDEGDAPVIYTERESVYVLRCALSGKLSGIWETPCGRYHVVGIIMRHRHERAHCHMQCVTCRCSCIALGWQCKCVSSKDVRNIMHWLFGCYGGSIMACSRLQMPVHAAVLVRYSMLCCHAAHRLALWRKLGAFLGTATV